MLKFNNEQSTRLKRLIRNYIITLSVGFGYLIWVLITNIKIPCVFYLITDKYCPGCGVSRMCMAIARLDFSAAMSHNVLVFCLLPVAMGLLIYKSAEYVKTGKTKDGLVEKIIYIIAFVLCIAFWILRNMEGFAYLAP